MFIIPTKSVKPSCWLQKRMILLSRFLIIVLNVFFVVDGYSSGGPNNRKVCTSLIPGHGSRQNTPSPYKLTLKEIDELVGLDLVATLQVTFAGFIVQARNTNDHSQIIDGYFTETSNNTYTKSCLSNVHNTWTHKNGEPKIKVSTKWAPVPNFNGSIFFLATVVQVKQAYWDQIKSNPVYFINGKITDESSFVRHSKLLDDGASLAEASLKSFELNYDDCNSKMCLSLGEESECFSRKSCRSILSVSKNELEENEFNIHAKPNENHNNIYYSMAFSEDDKMGDDFVVDCFVDSNGKVRVGLSYNEGKTNNPLFRMNPSILSQSNGKYVDGIVHCKWKLKQKFKVKNKEYDLQNKYHIFLAAGNLENDYGFKDYHDLKVKTSVPVDLASVGSFQVKDLNILIRIHGSLMLIAWFGTVPTAIILARYFKNSWQGRLICGVQIWFAFHRSLMILSLCLMVIAQVCIFYYVGEYRMGLHQILGSIAFILALFQPFGALFRPHPGSPKRWIFNWMHWLGGTTAHISAAATIFVASRLKLANLSDSFLYVAIGWVLCHVVLHLLFQFYSFCTSDSSKPSDIAMQDLQQRHIYGETQKSSKGFHYFLLTFYIILIGFLVTILVIFVFVPNIVKDFL